MYNTVLIVDDDKRIRSLLAQILDARHYKTFQASSAVEARQILNLHQFDLVILDIMMPGENGYQLLEFIRSKGSTYENLPVIFLSAKSAMGEKIMGLKSGADDYVSKPFEPEELLARMESVLRRSNRKTKIPINQQSIRLGDFIFNAARGILLKGEDEVVLSSSEVMVLKILVQRPHEPFTRDELAQRIGHQVSSRSVDVQIARLRKKLEDGQLKYIKTIRHLGYALCPD